MTDNTDQGNLKRNVISVEASLFPKRQRYKSPENIMRFAFI